MREPIDDQLESLDELSLLVLRLPYVALHEVQLHFKRVLDIIDLIDGFVELVDFHRPLHFGGELLDFDLQVVVLPLRKAAYDIYLLLNFPELVIQLLLDITFRLQEAGVQLLV